MAETEKMDISYMGPIFKKYRVDANRTQEEVAEKVGITARFLMALENEEKRPNADDIPSWPLSCNCNNSLDLYQTVCITI